MNFFGRNIDKATVDKITQMLNTPEGEVLKSKLSGLDKNEVLKAIENIDVSKLDFDEFVKTVQSLDKTELLNTLKKVDYSKFRR